MDLLILNLNILKDMKTLLYILLALFTLVFLGGLAAFYFDKMVPSQLKMLAIGYASVVAFILLTLSQVKSNK